MSSKSIAGMSLALVGMFATAAFADPPPYLLNLGAELNLPAVAGLRWHMTPADIEKLVGPGPIETTFVYDTLKRTVTYQGCQIDYKFEFVYGHLQTADATVRQTGCNVDFATALTALRGEPEISQPGFLRWKDGVALRLDLGPPQIISMDPEGITVVTD